MERNSETLARKVVQNILRSASRGLVDSNYDHGVSRGPSHSLTLVGGVQNYVRVYAASAQPNECQLQQKKDGAKLKGKGTRTASLVAE